MPLIPTAFIVARNIAISGDWGKVDQSHIESATSAGGSVGYGPFKLSGRYETGSSHDRFSSHYEDGTIRVPGLQIIAWVSEIVPFSPPEPIREPKGPVPLMYAERREQLVFL